MEVKDHVILSYVIVNDV